MPAPEKPGWYWWAENPAKSPRCIELYADNKGDLRVLDGRFPLLLGMAGGKWGERIPDNKRLKAMKELAKGDPWVVSDWWDDPNECTRCRHCGHPAYPVGEHEPTCAWLMAQEKSE